MLSIPCPWCGPRNDAEFVSSGEAHLLRPHAGDSDDVWGTYLYFRRNVKGVQSERWFHVHGCRRWFNIDRHTGTHAITRAYPVSMTKDTLP